ncbi:hypothetical protein LK542_17615 [Massilia sp. IC2-477]|uniref:hypothetical protein n=1 Tax=Massilia sp. IC2-477 TaxID=2887198 RepID=UPI001D11EC12|nr:hypothetical protein [Massilia sp. IC2-477]MCC2957438.1 hypothetical protein [Massilia sp. IC2-477]
MALPELGLQFVYARLAWGLVLAALVAGAWPAAWRMPPRALAGIVAGSLLLMALPGAASPAWHLGLAFQYPSALLAALCVARLHARWRGERPGTMPTQLAAALALGGALLYLDAFGLLSRGFYYAGFGPGAALCAVLLAGACAWSVLKGRARRTSCAVLGALLLFSLLRLPSGNLADALLDPLLWAWALVSLGAAALRALLGRTSRAQPAAVQHELPALHSTGNEPFSPIKE